MSEKNSAGAASKTPNLPLLYKNLIALSTKEHANLKINMRQDYTFAAEVNAIPVVVSEFIHACKHYPIFFSNLENPVPLVAVGMHNENRNMFIDSNGVWKAGMYIPLYLRRYPFILVSANKGDNAESKPNEEQLVLVFDDSAPHFKGNAGVSLFEGEENKRPVDIYMNHSKEYAQIGRITQNFVEALQQHKLLDWQSLNMTTPGSNQGEGSRLFNFLAVNPNKLTELKDDVVIDFYRKGWLSFIYAHLISLGNWIRIVQEEY